MNIIYLLLPMALLLVACMLGFFYFASKRGEFDDLETPAHRMLFDDIPLVKGRAAPTPVDNDMKEPKRKLTTEDERTQL